MNNFPLKKGSKFIDGRIHSSYNSNQNTQLTTKTPSLDNFAFNNMKKNEQVVNFQTE